MMKLLWLLAGISSTALVGVSMADVPVFGQAISGLPGSEGEALFKYVFGGGAVTILGALAFYLAVFVLPRSQDKHEARIEVIEAKHAEAIKGLGEKHAETVRCIADRFDGWEQARHDDANNLNATLRDMIAHCAKQRG